MDLRQQVIDYMKDRGVKQLWFYNQLNIGKSHFSAWVRGEVNISEEVEEKLKEILRKSI